MNDPRLPRSIEDEPGAEHLATELAARARPLWAGAEWRAPQVELAPALEAALESAFSAGRIVRGLEGAQCVLLAEARGLTRVDRMTGIQRGGRISRLLVLSDDGSERFYREVDSLLRRHAPRVFALRLSVDEASLGRLIFGPEQVARLLLVEHKDAVAAVFLALAAQWSGEGAPAR